MLIWFDLDMPKLHICIFRSIFIKKLRKNYIQFFSTNIPLCYSYLLSTNRLLLDKGEIFPLCLQVSFQHNHPKQQQQTKNSALREVISESTKRSLATLLRQCARRGQRYQLPTTIHQKSAYNLMGWRFVIKSSIITDNNID